MPGRYEYLDSDANRLPDGMERVGYDEADQRYTYRDADGSYWYGEEGSHYGPLHRASTERQSGFNGEGVPASVKAADRRLMAPFVLIVVVTLMALFWFLYRGDGSGGMTWPDKPAKAVTCDDGMEAYRIVTGDTCWDIAEKRNMKPDDLTSANPEMKCDKLTPGQQICVSAPSA